MPAPTNALAFRSHRRYDEVMQPRKKAGLADTDAAPAESVEQGLGALLGAPASKRTKFVVDGSVGKLNRAPSAELLFAPSRVRRTTSTKAPSSDRRHRCATCAARETP